MRPEEMRALLWSDVRENTIAIERALNPDGSVKSTKTTKRRSVRLMGPLAQDLREYRMLAGRPAGAALIVSGADGAPGRSMTGTTGANAPGTRHVRARA
jgi:integrase